MRRSSRKEKEVKRREITRRDFLKMIGIVGATAALRPVTEVANAWEIGPSFEEPPVLPGGALIHFLDGVKKKEIFTALSRFEELSEGFNPIATYAALVAHNYGLLHSGKEEIDNTVRRLYGIEPQHAVALELFRTLKEAYSDRKEFRELLKRVHSIDPSSILRAEEILHDTYGIRTNILSMHLLKDLSDAIRSSTMNYREIRIPVLTKNYINKARTVLKDVVDPYKDSGWLISGALWFILGATMFNKATKDVEHKRKYFSLGASDLLLGGLSIKLGLKKRSRIPVEGKQPIRLLYPHDLYGVDKNPVLRRQLGEFTKLEREIMKKLPEPPIVKVKIKKTLITLPG